MKRKPLTVAGLYLWKVCISKYFSGHLWITTSSPSFKVAAEKAQTFIARNYPSDCRVTSVEDSGTIDA